MKRLTEVDPVEPFTVICPTCRDLWEIHSVDGIYYNTFYQPDTRSFIHKLLGFERKWERRFAVDCPQCKTPVPISDTNTDKLPRWFIDSRKAEMAWIDQTWGNKFKERNF